MKQIAIYIAGVWLCIAGCRKKTGNNEVMVIGGKGNIQGEVNQFRALLGNLNTGEPKPGGRREVNWDGVPDELLGTPLPDDFFNQSAPGALVARQRGLVYTSRSGSFIVSETNFSEINALAAGSFKSFSGTNTFANTSSTLWEVGFRVPGKMIAAGVRGFGMIFSDVDQDNSTFLELFNGDKSLGKFFVEAHDATSTFSFLGIYLPADQQITRIAVGHPGMLASGKADVSDGGPEDLITIDDLLNSEPLAQ